MKMAAIIWTFFPISSQCSLVLQVKLIIQYHSKAVCNKKGSGNSTRQNKWQYLPNFSIEYIIGIIDHTMKVYQSKKASLLKKIVSWKTSLSIGKWSFFSEGKWRSQIDEDWTKSHHRLTFMWCCDERYCHHKIKQIHN